MNLFHLITILSIATTELTAWRIFHKGRMVGGNLGEPPTNKHLVDNSTSHHNEVVADEWFNQTLDHFNPGDERTWKQRYFTNTQFYDRQAGGPVFLMIGGEGTASPKWMSQGSWVQYARKFGALLFQLEHRYYGRSHPTADLSVDNLQFLTSQQALADLAAFIVAMNKERGLPADVKWITFGGSYPGSLSAWMRYKYPHLVHGAMSASGPLLAEVDFQDYFRVVVDSLQTHSDTCVQAVKSAFEQVAILLKTRLGQQNLNKKFELCVPIEKSLNNSRDLSNLFETLAGNFAGVVQYNKDNRVGSPAGANITIDVVCNLMVNDSLGAPVNRLAAVNSLLLKTYDQKCLDFEYDNMIETLRNESWDSETAEGGRQWTFQTCNEFGFYQTSSHKPQIFSDQFPAEFFVQQCEDIFGTKYNDNYLNGAVDRTNVFYGALGIEVSNVVFVQGSIDPWHALGITKTQEQRAPAIYIKGTAHCANMYPETDGDLPALKAARVEIEQLIDSWLSL